jgi:hypothetical protein
VPDAGRGRPLKRRDFQGALKPSVEAGTVQGSAPARLEFGPGSGSLASIEGPGTVTARLKLMGFERR